VVDTAKMHPVNRRLDIPRRIDDRSVRAPNLDPCRALDDVGVPEYPSDDERPRCGPDLRRRIGLVQSAIVHDTDTIPEGERLVVIVSDMDRGSAGRFKNPGKFTDEPIAKMTVKRSERFVEQQHPRRRSERSSERNTLGLTARECRHRSPFIAGETNQLKEFAHALPTGGRGNRVHTKPKLDVPSDVAVREKDVVLEHQTERTGLWCGSGDVITVE
jgi:hypothetical protein